MNTFIAKLEDLKVKTQGYWADRVLSQLGYAVKLSKLNGGKYDVLIGNAIRFLAGRYVEEGAVTKDAASKTEEMIQELSASAKSFKMICTAHAHIDMNWMWGFAETVAITLDTFRTMLNLMKEYPKYRFSQSQASVYKIVEDYDPVMLEEIKARVWEGRWEVTASTWVETDKNMPNGESLSRHILYTRKYLAKLLDLDPDTLNIDFEPDTFGHNANVPEILSRGGVKYYYHCRGYEGYNIYRWEAPSGNSVIVYREPLWYNSEIRPDMALYVPEFCTERGIDTMLKVYGVGDHGGGPTRRDIEKIIDMASWPVFPAIKFGTFGEYFALLEKIKDRLPVVKQELNFVFTGCYTTQTRIKTANRIAEAKLNEAEAFSAVSAVFTGGRYKTESFEKAWKKVLFNHFHDILPGSGIIDTREYALGQFQQVLAIANTETVMALRNIASQINTSGLDIEEEDIAGTVSEGAGVGYSIEDFSIPQTERGRGKLRVYHFFNPSTNKRSEAAEIAVWDWPGNKDRIEIKDTEGCKVEFQIVPEEQPLFPGNSYWGHTYIKLFVEVKVPALGYSTYTLGETLPEDVVVRLPVNPRIETLDCFVMENDFIKVAFNTKDASITSFIDKRNNTEMVDKNRPAGIFRLIHEDDGKGMTAWVVGRYMNITNLNSEVKVGKVNLDTNSIRQWISYEIVFGSSKLKAVISLDKNSSRLNYEIVCDWKEIGEKGRYIPQLSFHMPMGYKCEKYMYDIPFGTIVRDSVDMDVPANSWVAGIPKEKHSNALMLVTASKYGFRGVEDSMNVTLIRSSYDPDPYPEFGIHKFRFAVSIANPEIICELVRQAFDYNHPLNFVSSVVHNGMLPLVNSFLSLEGGNIAISSVKMPEEDNGCNKLIIRVYETEGVKAQASLKFNAEAVKAYFTDINEKPIMTGVSIHIERNIVTFEVEKYSVASVCVEF